jgi:hypothetical protein
MKKIILSLALLTSVCRAGVSLKDYAGTYVCPQAMQMKPAFKQMDKVRVEVKIEGDKAKVVVAQLNGFTFASESMPNGLVAGDFEYRTAGPVQLLALSKAGPGKMLNFTYDASDMALVGTACLKK